MLALPARRAFLPGHEFFEEGNWAREDCFYAHSTRASPCSQDEAGPGFNALESLESFCCGSCGANMPSGHLLDLHLSETHDSFFQAQAAKRLSVYVCLVEGCTKAFSSIMDRRKHLHDTHVFATNYAFDRMHLTRRQPQVRPEAHLQKPSLGRKAVLGAGHKTGREPTPPARLGAAARQDVAGDLVEPEKQSKMPGSKLAKRLGAQPGQMPLPPKSVQEESGVDTEMESLGEEFSRLATGEGNRLHQPKLRSRSRRVMI